MDKLTKREEQICGKLGKLPKKSKIWSYHQVYGCDGGCREIFETLKDSFYFTWGQDFCDYKNLTFSDDFHRANNHSDHPVFERFIDEGQFWLKWYSILKSFDLKIRGKNLTEKFLRKVVLSKFGY